LVKTNSISQGSYRPWKVLEFYCSEFQAWKVLKKGIGPGKPWKSPGILKQMSWNFEFLVCLRNIRRCSLAPVECKKTVKRPGSAPDPTVILCNAVTSVVVVVVVVTSVIDLVCECSYPGKS